MLYNKTGYSGVFGMGAGILAIDFLMRLLVIEKKVAARYDNSGQNGAANPRQHGTRDGDDEGQEASEEDVLLPKKEEEYYTVPEGQNRVIRALPILYCFSDPRLLVALLLLFVQAFLLACFDATIPTEADSLFGFDSLKSGLLFIALDVPYLLLGPIAGWTVVGPFLPDKHTHSTLLTSTGQIWHQTSSSHRLWISCTRPGPAKTSV